MSGDLVRRINWEHLPQSRRGPVTEWDNGGETGRRRPILKLFSLRSE